MYDEGNSPAAECAACPFETAKKACYSEAGHGPRECPTRTSGSVLQAANKEYADPQVGEFALNASRQEAECYANRGQQPYVLQPTKTRIVEICEFAHKMNYSRLGLAFCIGLQAEAVAVDRIFKSNGFEVVSILCKAGRTPKDLIGIQDSEKIVPGSDEAMCNPVFQAKLLNHAQTQFNVLLGLCVGHDSLFFKYSQAPTTVLAVKDRITGHNPLAAVYTAGSYYRKIMNPQF